MERIISANLILQNSDEKIQMDNLQKIIVKPGNNRPIMEFGIENIEIMIYKDFNYQFIFNYSNKLSISGEYIKYIEYIDVTEIPF